MLNINILFPKEKRRIIQEVSKEIKKKYHTEVTKLKFSHIGDPKVYLYVWLEDENILYVTADVRCVNQTMTICEDMSM